MSVFLPAYSWMVDLLQLIREKKPLTLDEINLVGGRFSGKSTNVVLFIALACLIPDVVIGVVFLRASKDGIMDLIDDVMETLDTWDIPYKWSSTKKQFIIGNSKIKMIGLNSMSKSKAKKAGFPKFNCDYLFKVFEECYEFKEQEHNAIQEAIRHIGKEPYYLTFNICNPWIASNWFVAYCSRYVRFDENILKTKGSQIGIREFIDNETKFKKVMLFQYSNWRTAREFLSSAQITLVRQYWQTNRLRARTADWGMPGYEDGGIYLHELLKIGEPYYSNEPQYILGGMDYGWSQNANGGKTICHFISATLQKGVDVYGEFKHDNHVAPITQNLLASNIVDFYAEQVDKFMLNNSIYTPPQVVVRCDNSNIAIIQLLNNVAVQKGYHRWLSFVSCSKYPTQDRISVTLALMSAQKLRVDKSCETLLSEFESAHYEDKPEQKRAKENDHALNAFEYAIEPLLYLFPQELGMDHKLLKRRL